MKKIVIVFGHHNTKNSFNSAIRDNFLNESKLYGHQINLINLFEEKEQLPFYNSDFTQTPKCIYIILSHHYQVAKVPHCCPFQNPSKWYQELAKNV